MKKIYLTMAALACFQLSVEAQYTTATLNGNNIEAQINNGGVFFNDAANTSHGYEYPKGSGKHLIYSNSFWFAARDMNGNFKLAAQLYELGDDLFPGAIKPGTASTSPGDDNNKEIYQVAKSEIHDHILNYSNAGYVVPASIADWPAHGDMSAGYDFYSAPFVDVNDDGMYEPLDGDYPKIRGDYATYLILNDKANYHVSGGAFIGVECHFMFYQFETNDYLNDMTFLNLKVINRSTQNYPDFKVASFLDADIGLSSDDAVGCDTVQRTMYTYNFTNYDNTYGENPPALGMVNLNHTMDVFGYYNYAGIQFGEPQDTSDYRYNLEAYWKDSSPFTKGGDGHGGTEFTNYMFPGNPNNPNEWSEMTAGTTPDERKMFMVSNIGPLAGGEEICLDYAYVIGDNGNHIENVDALLVAASKAQNFYDSQSNFVCENYEETLAIPSNEIERPNVYPNPSNGQITVDFTGMYAIEIHSLDGRRVMDRLELNNAQKINPSIDAGSYILSVFQNGKRFTIPIVVQ